MPREAPHSRVIVEPGYLWGSFLREIDGKLTEQIQLQCLGGFVVTQYYGIGREMSDIDCIVVLDSKSIDFAGKGFDLHKTNRLIDLGITCAKI
jgi:hypothetical protein